MTYALAYLSIAAIFAFSVRWLESDSDGHYSATWQETALLAALWPITLVALIVGAARGLRG